MLAAGSGSTLSRKTRSLSFVKDLSEVNGAYSEIKRTHSNIHGQQQPGLQQLKRGLSIISTLFRSNRLYYNAAPTSEEDALDDIHTLLAEYSRDMNVEFKGNLFSVSEFSQLSDVKRLFSLKKHEFGTWSRKTKIRFEIGKRYARETCVESEKILAIILVQDMKFGLTKMGKRYQFTVQGLDHKRELISRVYELSEAKNGGKNITSKPTSSSADLLQDESEEVLIPNHGYRFWVEFHAHVQNTRQSIQGIIDRSFSTTETYEIKEELAELEFQVKGLILRN